MNHNVIVWGLQLGGGVGGEIDNNVSCVWGSLAPRPPPFFFVVVVALLLLLQFAFSHKLKNKKWVRTGNEATPGVKNAQFFFLFFISIQV